MTIVDPASPRCRQVVVEGRRKLATLAHDLHRSGSSDVAEKLVGMPDEKVYDRYRVKPHLYAVYWDSANGEGWVKPIPEDELAEGNLGWASLDARYASYEEAEERLRELREATS